MSLASLYNHLCHFQSENVFELPVTLRRKTIFDIKRRFRWKIDYFRKNERDKIDGAGTHREAQMFADQTCHVWYQIR